MYVQLQGTQHSTKHKKAKFTWCKQLLASPLQKAHTDALLRPPLSTHIYTITEANTHLKQEKNKAEMHVQMAEMRERGRQVTNVYDKPNIIIMCNKQCRQLPAHLAPLALTSPPPGKCHPDPKEHENISVSILLAGYFPIFPAGCLACQLNVNWHKCCMPLAQLPH